MHQLEAAADHPRIAEFGAHLFGRGAGGDVEVLGFEIEQQVAHAAADQVGLVTGLLQALDHADRVAADLRPAAQRVLATGQHLGGTARVLDAAQRGTERLEQLLQHGRFWIDGIFGQIRTMTA
ncbi:hypothetical protein D9M70_447470 [compost metagenome]